jgi:glycosyltransferase involved in cell wall biosynthesis
MNGGAESPPVRRVLQVHTRYRQAGGEDHVVDAEKRLLEDAGIEVGQVIFDNADLRESESFAGDLRLAASAVWSHRAERRVRRAIASHQPDVMHVHNTFSAASPSVYAAAEAAGVPVIQTLHNYRFVCPAATVFRDGHACTDCVGRSIPWPGVLHACVRESRTQSLVVAGTLAFHRARGTFRRIDAYIALTEFQRGLMIAGGLPAERIRVVPNFLEPDPAGESKERRGVLFAGRLSIEKGIDTLIAAAALIPGAIAVAGTGPLADRVRRAADAGNLTYYGPLDRTSVAEALRRTTALVVPSIWFEGLPLVVLEAFGTGTPVIASRIGSLGELIEHAVNGLHVEPADDRALADSIAWAADHPAQMREMGAKARLRYEASFRGPAHLAALLDSYTSVLHPGVIA